MTTPARAIPLPISESAPDSSVWYAQGLRFACTQCGNCCSGAPGYVWVTTEDMQRMAAALTLAFDEFTRRYIRQIGTRYALVEKTDYDCIFLTRDGRGKTACSIHTSRPMQCRTWPFWNDNLKSPAAWERSAARCPGMNAAGAPHFTLEQIEAARLQPESP